ncbi:MAG: methylenetetrahydrofolate reductase [Brevibacterium yomogidense]|uniref:methylenetetrahydrofolate reductase n=1 Tax=Brevibacterium sp. Mu109 TaxID=1255669 RepID=UPI000C51C723|nr:methylenetetrahydrofolate reductase [Brevibacterium sp. Mu109]SMX83434.1 methylenetetrahydrofolate reductase (NADPH) [Brevibacterium sp. Mu109]
MTGDTSTIARLLRTARLEVLPTDSITAEVRAHAPQHRTVTITASESLGLDATLAVACALRADGRRVVPHLAARMVSGRSHLEDIVDRLHAAGVDAVFVPGGDATPGPGAYTSSLALLRDLEQMDHPFRDIGVAAYPESHPTIPDAEVVRALADKHPFATEMVSNLCFDPDALSAWIRSARDRGTALPLWLGVPGRVDAARLARVGARIGVGQSLRFLKGKLGTITRLVTPGGVDTHRLLTRMSGTLDDPTSRIAGLHLYTFNQVELTEAWLHDTGG